MPIPKNKFGYIVPDKRTRAESRLHEKIMADMPLMSATGRPIAGTGAGKVSLPFKWLEQLRGSYPAIIQTIGDCVSHGWQKMLMVTMCGDILARGEAEEWPGMDIATEWLYGTGRVLVGGGRLGNSDGSIGSWQARAVLDHGLLFRQVYGDYDLRKYSGQRAKDWGYRGLPYKLEDIADEHQISGKAVLVTSYEQARDAIKNGYTVAVCSNQGFRDVRDKEGFAAPSGSWSHCMHFCASDDEYRRPGLCCDNAHWGPNWISGPKRHDQPDGTFWVDADICDRMLRQEDSYVVPGVNGFEIRNIVWDLIGGLAA